MRSVFCIKCWLVIFLCIIFCAQTSFSVAQETIDSPGQEDQQEIQQETRQEVQQEVQPITYTERLSLARDFVTKLKSGISKADSLIVSGGSLQKIKKQQENVLPEGETLLLQPVLDKTFRLDGVIVARMHSSRVLLSLMDFVDILQLAISLDSEGETANGWYIREDNLFSLDLGKGEVKTPEGVFNISDDVFSENGDIFVPVEELALWIGVEAHVKVSYQELRITSEEMFPIQAKNERERNKYVRHDTPDPSLPLGGESYTVASIPVVDVTTRSRYSKDAGEGGESSHQANIKTVSDFAQGTLTTNTSLNDDNHLARVRALYEQDSVDGNLFGALKAKHFEIGDITTTEVPLGGSVSREVGVRVTNTDPLRNFSRARTVISGDAIPGWDVELYRKKQYIGMVHVGEDGFYKFENVTLYSGDNAFRLVFHGPQGEEREEEIYVPYDRDRLAQNDGIYDFSLSFDGQGTYVNNDLKNSDEDRGSMNLSAMYETPLTPALTGSVGFRSYEEETHRNYIGSAGLSWMFHEALINAGVAVDDEGEGAAEFSVRHGFGQHNFNYTSAWQSANFDDDSSSTDDDSDSFENSLSVNGPLPLSFAGLSSPRYNASFGYTYDDDGESLWSSGLGVNAGYRNVSFNGLLSHKTGDAIDEDRIDSTVNVNAHKNKDTLRLTADYEIKPDAKLDAISGAYTRELTDDLDFDLSVSKDEENSLVDYEARLDWQAGFIRISPSVSYSSEDEFFAGVNTRFGLMREPISGDIKMSERTITGNAFVSAFVFLDKDGDGKFNGDDEPLPDIVVSAPQNGRQVKTNDKGIALFERMVHLRLTDVYVDKNALPDPAWIPGFEGVSILPRQGYVAKVEIPIHMSGELDGTLYAKVVPDFDGSDLSSNSDISQIEPAAPKFENVPLRNVELELYNDKGEVEQSVKTESDGFYYFTAIPPGRYYLMISEESARHKNILRPKPEPIEVTYDGTLMYDHKIFVDTGEGDVPSEILSDLKAYQKRHPHVRFNRENYNLVLNLGEFNSRLLMSLVWYKLRTHYGEILGEEEYPLVPPAESYADVKTGKHSLRLALDENKTLDEAYAMCRSLMARGEVCKVEIYPSYYMSALAKKDVPQEVQRDVDQKLAHLGGEMEEVTVNWDEPKDIYDEDADVPLVPRFTATGEPINITRAGTVIFP